jgi:uncharacterized protein (DUF4213/DUF364 family)
MGMITSNDDLQRAYAIIREMYRAKAIVPGRLRKIGFGNKWNYVLAENDQSGLAFNFTADHAVYGQVDDLEQFINLQPYIGKTLFEFIEYLLLKKELQMRSLCLAALNALSHPLTSFNSLKERGIPVSSDERYDFIKSEDIVTVIGYGGVVNQIYGRCKELHVSDMRPRHTLVTLIVGEKIEYSPEKIFFHSAEENAEILAKSDVVMISGCTVVNGTYQEIINSAKKARIIGMFGPSAQIVTDFLLSNGINYISSSRICNPSLLEYQLLNVMNFGGTIKSNLKPYYVYNF